MFPSTNPSSRKGSLIPDLAGIKQIASSVKNALKDEFEMAEDRKVSTPAPIPSARIKFGHDMRAEFQFAPDYRNLNHGSYGTYPLSVRKVLRELQDMTEAQPDKFMRFQFVEYMDKSRESLSILLNAPVDELVFVSNPTTAINIVLRNLQYREKDCIVYFDTIYGAIEKTLFSIMEQTPQLSVEKIGVEAGYKLPCTKTQIVQAFSKTISRLKQSGMNPRVAIFDTIISVPGVRFPFEEITRLCKEHGILSMIDGAHGVGQIELDLTELDADFLVSACHKWLFTPRGCAIFHVPKRNQELIRTNFPTSHGYHPLPTVSGDIRNPLGPTDKSRFVTLFQLTSTADKTPFYCVPAALDFRQNVCGGERVIQFYCREIAQRGCDLVAEVLGTKVMDEMPEPGMTHNWEGTLRDCAMGNVLLPISVTDGVHQNVQPSGAGVISADETTAPGTTKISYNPQTLTFTVIVNQIDVPTHVMWMQRTLPEVYHTCASIFEYKGQIWARLSGQIYLELSDFQWFGMILKTLCQRLGAGESLKAALEPGISE